MLPTLPTVVRGSILAEPPFRGTILSGITRPRQEPVEVKARPVTKARAVVTPIAGSSCVAAATTVATDDVGGSSSDAASIVATDDLSACIAGLPAVAASTVATADEDIVADDLADAIPSNDAWTPITPQESPLWKAAPPAFSKAAGGLIILR